MLSLDEAIQHCHEKAKELREEANTRRQHSSERNDCLECANEHEQLSEWLRELKERRETMEMIKKHYILIEKSPRDNPNDFMTGRIVPDVL